MTRIDFYILDQADKDARLSFACRLAEKAVKQDLEVLINAASTAEAARLDELLWTFSQGSFLPHRRIDDQQHPDEGERVLLTCDSAPESGAWELMINLAPRVPEFFSRFRRVAELVSAEREDKAAGRERFRYYRDRGYELRTHKV